MIILILMASILLRSFGTTQKVHNSGNLQRVLRQKRANPLSIPMPERNDVSKYTYLLGNQRFEELGDKLHKDL